MAKTKRKFTQYEFGVAGVISGIIIYLLTITAYSMILVKVISKLIFFRLAALAQLAEHSLSKRKVVGSIPTSGSSLIRANKITK